jgi:cytochrome c-type biogenesis protein CcmH
VKRRLFALALCVVGLAAIGCSDSDANGRMPVSARSVGERLLAPCCWLQTLDFHESELASSLRTEIAQRLERGESGEAIEDDLVARYGERIRAVPKGRDPRSAVPVVVGAVMLVSLLGLVVLVRRRTKRPASPTVVADTDTPRGKRDEYDERIEDELAQLGDL